MILRRPSSLKQRSPNAFSIMSYNLLAPIYVRPVDKRTGKIQEFAAFRWCEDDDVLNETSRAKKITQSIRDAHADIVCLQEVQFVKIKNQWKLPSWLEVLSEFKSVLPCEKELNHMADRNQRVLNKYTPVANAILYRHDRFEVISEISKRNQRVAATFIHCGQKEQTLFVASLHLDATDTYKRSSTLRKCMCDFEKSKCRGAIFAGDMNSEFSVGTLVSAMCRDAKKPDLKILQEECFNALREEGTEKDLEKYIKEWDRNRKDAKVSRCLLQRVPTKETRCGFDHGKLVGPCISWKLDHILFSERTIQLKHFWETLETDLKALKTGLPNQDNPSDHIPVASVFKWKKSTTTTTTTTATSATTTNVTAQEDTKTKNNNINKLRTSMEHINTRHAQEMRDLETEIKASEPSKLINEYNNTLCKMKEAKKRQRPPEDVIKFYRFKRSKQVELKNKHKAERWSWCAGLTDEIYADLYDLTGGGIAKWI